MEYWYAKLERASVWGDSCVKAALRGLDKKNPWRNGLKISFADVWWATAERVCAGTRQLILGFKVHMAHVYFSNT